MLLNIAARASVFAFSTTMRTTSCGSSGKTSFRGSGIKVGYGERSSLLGFSINPGGKIIDPSYVRYFLFGRDEKSKSAGYMKGIWLET